MNICEKNMYEALNANCEHKERDGFMRWNEHKYRTYDYINYNYCYTDCVGHSLCNSCKEILHKYKNEDTLRKVDLLKLTVDNAQLILDNEKLILDIEKLILDNEKLRNDIDMIKQHLDL